MRNFYLGGEQRRDMKKDDGYDELKKQEEKRGIRCGIKHTLVPFNMRVEGV